VTVAELELADWRRRVNNLYARVRSTNDPKEGHELWRSGRDALFLDHPQSPLRGGDSLRETGIPYWPYDPALRFEVSLDSSVEPQQHRVPTDGSGTTTLRAVGKIVLPEPFGADLYVWWLDQYAGGLFIPLRDGTAGTTTYGGGRYLLDTAKGADLGGSADTLLVDLNFLYHPSCRYDSAWQCPLAPPENVIPAPVQVGERL
jgi:uncharacterized protein